MQLSKFLKLNKLIFVFFPQLWISNLAISVLIVVLSLQLRLAWDWNYLHFFLWMKLTGYGLSILVEYFFYRQKRSYFIKNIGFSYRQVYTTLFLTDLLCFYMLCVMRSYYL